MGPWVLTCCVTSGKSPRPSLCLTCFLCDQRSPQRQRDHMLSILQRCTEAPGTWAPPNVSQQWGCPPRTEGSLLSSSTSMSSRWATGRRAGYGLCFHRSSAAADSKPLATEKLYTSPLPNPRHWLGRLGTYGEDTSLQVSPRGATSREGSTQAGRKWRLGREGTLPGPPLCLALCSESTQSLAQREQTLPSSLRSLLPRRLPEGAGESLAVSLHHRPHGPASPLQLS